MTKIFQGEEDPSPFLGTGQHFRVLVGVAQILGQGLTLNRAHRLVLMEPSLHAGVEKQIADRVHRLGSQTDRCSFYRLINPDSALEELLVSLQDGQLHHEHLAEWFGLLPEETSNEWNHQLAEVLDKDEDADEDWRF